MTRFLVRLAAITLLALPAYAAEAPPSADLDVYAGQFSALRDNKDKSAEFGAEYRFKDQWYGLRPTVGVMANTDSAMYGYAGINWDLPLGIAPIYITPGVKVGGYDHGDSKALGYGIEFRDSIEMTYRFDDGQRVGAALTHMSNASLGNRNPGVEMIEAVYSHPIGN